MGTKIVSMSNISFFLNKIQFSLWKNPLTFSSLMSTDLSEDMHIQMIFKLQRCIKIFLDQDSGIRIQTICSERKHLCSRNLCIFHFSLRALDEITEELDKNRRINRKLSEDDFIDFMLNKVDSHD